MKKIFITIISLSFSLSMYSQVKYTVTDSTFVGNIKFLLIETEDRVAKMKAFIKEGKEIPISGVIKMTPPVYFVKRNGTDELLQNDFMVDYKGGETSRVFLIIGNKAPRCLIEEEKTDLKDDFCGMNVQGVVMSTEDIGLTEYMYNSFNCAKHNWLEVKDLYSFIHDHFKMKKKAEAEKKKKAKKK